MFPLNKPLGGEFIYHKRRREDQNIYLVARRGDWILASHQCEKFWFVNFVDAALDRVALQRAKP